MLKDAPTLAVPLNVPPPTFCTVKLFVLLVPLNTVPYDMLPGVTWITGFNTGALVALPDTTAFVPPPPLKLTL
jgi:hypothetical protein